MTTAQDCRQNFLRLGGGENKFHMRGRLLERLQKRVERSGREHVHFIDKINFVTALGWRITNVVAQLAHIFDAVVAGAVDLDDVETVARGNLAAVVAHAAWRHSRSFHAIERLRQNAGGRGFPDPAWTDKKVRMRKPILCNGILERTRDMRLPDEVVERLRPIFSCENFVTHALNLNGEVNGW